MHGIVETREQGHEGALARARRPHERDQSPRRRLEGHALEAKAGIALAAVRETDVLEAHLAAHRGKRACIRRVLHLGFRIEDFKHPARSRRRALDEPHGLRDRVDGAVQGRQIRHEHDDVAGRKRAREREPASHVEHPGRAEGDQDVHDSRIAGLEDVEPKRRAERPRGGIHHARALARLGGEGLHDLNGSDATLCLRKKSALRLALLGGEGRDAPSDGADRHEEQRRHGEEDPGKERVHADHDGRHSEQEHDRSDKREQAIHRHGLHGVRIEGHPIDEILAWPAAEEAEGHALEMGQELRTQVAHHALADADGESVQVNAQQGKRPLKREQAHAGGCEEGKGVEIARPRERERLPAQHLVHHDLERPRLSDLEDGAQGDERESQNEARPVGPQVAADAAVDAHQP